MLGRLSLWGALRVARYTEPFALLVGELAYSRMQFTGAVVPLRNGLKTRNRTASARLIRKPLRQLPSCQVAHAEWTLNLVR
jgi:hypothetical protein